MNVEFINPFIEASTSIIRQTTGITPKLGKLYVKNAPYRSDSVLVMIGLTGKIYGSVVINFSVESACKVASAMMGGLEVKSLDEIAKSAIAELCNMILGNTATVFSTKSIEIDITPPAVLTGQNMQLSVHRSVIVCIPLELENGAKIELDISYIDKI